MKKYIVYQTVNLVNSHIYIGVHCTEDPDVFDGYFGCGVSYNKNYYMVHPKTYFQKALKKYGFKNFLRTTLAVFDTAEEAYALEELIVNKEFVKRKDTYNLSLGGGKGSNYYRPVYQFSLNGKFLCEWDNLQRVSEAMGVSYQCISRAISNKGSSAGYYWGLSDSIDINEYTNHVGKEVYQYDSDGVLMEVYSSLTHAANSINDSEKSIYRSIASHVKRKDCYWSFKHYDRFTPKSISLRGVTIYVYTLEGLYVEALNSTKRIKEFFGVKSYTVLKAALLNNKPYKGYQLRLEYLDYIQPTMEFELNKPKRIGCFDATGELVEEFDSIKQATRKYGTKVIRVLRNQKDNVKGYTFKVL